MAELRRRKAAKRPDAVAARRAERERLAREAAERHRNRPITIMTAARWLGESPPTTLTRVSRGQGLRAVTMEDGSTRVRASDVKQLIWTDAGRLVYHTPSPRPCGIWEGEVLAVSQWARIFGAAPLPHIVVAHEPVILCPKCGLPLEAGHPSPDGTVLHRCSMWQRCDYLAVRQGDEWREPPGFCGPWSAPAPEGIVARRLEQLTFAQARDYFVDPEADLMPQFEFPGAQRRGF